MWAREAVQGLEPGSPAEAGAGRDRQSDRELTLGWVGVRIRCLQGQKGNSGLMDMPESGRMSRARYNVAVDYLRTFAVMLVLAHHTSLAYFPRVPLTKTSLLAQPRLWKAFPILDSHRWTAS